MDIKRTHYDLIIIGSGIGALTVASLMAQYRDKKVLILEQHFKAGGFTHVFKREGKFLWDVGIHYIGDMDENSMLRKIFDLITRNQVEWNKMPQIFEKFVYPGFTFGENSDPEQYQKDLISLFPEESEAIRNYFNDVRKVASWHGRHMILKALPPFLDKFKHTIDLIGSSSALITTKEYLDGNFRSPKLKAVLASQWGDYGLPPSLSAFAIHALIVAHYLKGGYYPIGGSGVIAQSIQKIIQEKEGGILLSREVQEILIQDGKAVGVRVKNRKKSEEAEREVIEEYTADAIVSNAGAYNTYTKLIPSRNKIPFLEKLKSFAERHPMTTNVTLYIGFKDDPKKLGFLGENYWIYDSLDHDRNFEVDWILGNRIPGAYLSFPSLKDPHAHAHTAEVIAFSSYAPFLKWKDQPWKERDQEYKQLKDSIRDKLLNYIEDRFPGFKNIVEYTEVSTPLTTEHFTLHKNGTIYGLPCVPDRFREEAAPWFSPITPIKNLFLTGADAASPGMSGAMMGGISAVAHLTDGIKMIQIFREAGKKNKNRI
ncbi:phytoene desaturase family protein [Leptospira alstonii]|uniref:NAD(P)-binding Rossmann-like domain protein n=2 Tax=Leptospira alstonii TaxID=28452 RepID=M6CXV8_9LEPT|nr:NAD(P)/FAD-dependent oxidoreductase [Leptospira alstonii]EMJ96722.1 NAD(P)-binding Rossmann-like domain protein [Leptospira alstonii serovar Sichuan str. 79601]EQA78751.1 NAD(P)-binding Rossmann-like domain protein [Leptospira alstonii serovar Pingchang str. 80-412]